jgi:hypothetical protein
MLQTILTILNVIAGCYGFKIVISIIQVPPDASPPEGGVALPCGQELQNFKKDINDIVDHIESFSDVINKKEN